MPLDCPKKAEPGYGERLAAARKLLRNTQGRKLSQASLGDLLGVHAMYIWKLENEATLSAESRRPVTERTFKALASIGINPWWVASGQEPILLQPTNNQEAGLQALLAHFSQMTSIWRVKEGHGCAPTLQNGDLAILRANEPRDEAIWVCAPPGVEAVIDGQASSFCMAGYLRNTGTTASPRWCLYQPTAPEQSIQLTGWTLVGEIAQIVRTIP